MVKNTMNIKCHLRCIAFLLAISLLSGCGGGGSSAVETTAAPATTAATETATTTAGFNTEVMETTWQSDIVDPESEINTTDKSKDKVDTINLKEQSFTKVSSFSEGLAWVQYNDINDQSQTSVINTEGDVVFTLEHDVDYYSQFCDGYAFYLYSTDSMSKKSLDNIVSCIIDNEGNITYSSQNDDIRIILGYGNGHFLTIEHVSNFETDEWRFGSIDENGDTLINFDNYNNDVFLFWNSDTYEYFTGNFLSKCSYLGDGIFDICSHNGKYVLYDVNKCEVIYSRSSGRPDIKGGFQDQYMIYGLHANSYFIVKIDSNGNEEIIDARSPFDMDEIFISAYSDGIYFYDHAYYDIDNNTQINLSKYADKTIGGGLFKSGYAPLYICGADNKDYFTIIDMEGTELFEPILGSPTECFSEGYLTVQLEDGCALFNSQGEKVLESPYNILGNIPHPSNYKTWEPTKITSKVKNGFFIACKENSTVPTLFIGVDGSYIGQ